MSDKRFRLQHIFWLNLNKPDEEQLADQIEELKTERNFARTVRDGIRLICDLRAGRIDTLLELFPWVESALTTPPETASARALREQLERIEQQLLRQGNTPIDFNGGERVTLDLPTFTEQTPEEKAEAAANTRTEFAQGMGDLFADDDDLWD